MEMIVMATDIQPEADSKSCWLDAICKMIHNVQVDNLSARNFAATISGRRYGNVSGALSPGCRRAPLKNACPVF